MNIWDSVHRGLEKASQEAGRIARIQRLRFTIDKLSRDIDTQEGTLITKTMELFLSQQLTQGELISICQQLADLHQQLAQAQNELKQLHTQGPAQPATPATQANTPPDGFPLVSHSAPTVYAPPPPYQPYIDGTVPIPTPPPPPGVEPLVEPEGKTADSGTPPSSLPTVETRYCPHCRVEALPGNAYCHNCGKPLQESEIAHLPTVRGSTSEISFVAEQETIQIDQPPATQETSQADGPTPAEKDGGQ